jgi:hypothetical protein
VRVVVRNSFFDEQMGDPTYAAEAAGRARVDAVDSILRALDYERE